MTSWYESTFPITEPAGLLAILLAVLAGIFRLVNHPATAGFFKVVPSLIFCYFIPTLLTTLGIIPNESELYDWVKLYVLPASLVLLIIALDIPGIIRLGPKAIIMLLAGTGSVVIGGPIALWITKSWLPEDAWRGMTALCGSWIGGGANFVALGQMAEASSEMIAAMVIPDVLVANVWMGVLLFFAGRERRMDERSGADATAIRDLERRMTEYREQTTRIPTLADLLMILAIGFGASWIGHRIGNVIPEISTETSGTLISSTTWKYILVTSFGLLLSLSPARKLEGAGASKVGSVMIYILVACIGASADFRRIFDAPALIVMGFIWMFIHIVIMLVVGKLIRAPIFFVAIGSQANIGGAASAPVVAAAFHPSLAPVGVLLAIAGYLLGTYAGIICMNMLKYVADAN